MIAAFSFLLRPFVRAVVGATAGLLRLSVRLGRRLTAHRLASGRPRALWGITPLLTLPLKARATERLGFASTSLVFTSYHITSGFDVNLRKLVGAVGKVVPSLLPALYNLILSWAMLRYDVIHYFADRGIRPAMLRFGIDLDELDLLKASGKRVYVLHYGADVRMRGITAQVFDQPNACTECDAPGRYCLCDDEAGVPMLAAISARVTAVISMGDMQHYMPGCIVAPYWPIDVEAITPTPPVGHDGPLRIMHAPNHLHFKGTRHIEAAIERLKEEGHDIAYLRISGLPNSEVMRLFASADLVVEQLLGGMHGYTALEAMAHGKPVISYIKDSGFVIEPDAWPVMNATPGTIEQVLRWVLENRDRLHILGAQGRRHVERHASIEAVAARLASVYLASAVWPEPVRRKLEAEVVTHQAQLAALPNITGWDQPFRPGGTACAKA
jgi:hypothetical protein